MDDSTRLDETDTYRRMEAREIPEDTYYHVPRMQKVAVFGQAAAVLPDDRPAFRRRWVTQSVTFTCVQCQTIVTQERYPGPVPRYCRGLNNFSRIIPAKGPMRPLKSGYSHPFLRDATSFRLELAPVWRCFGSCGPVFDPNSSQKHHTATSVPRRATLEDSAKH